MSWLFSKWERRRSGAGGVLLLAATLVGCAAPSYSPNLRLPYSDSIIDATVEVHDLQASHSLISGRETYGLDAPKTKQVGPTQLTQEVQDELIAELKNAGIFSRVTRFDPNPDFILTGRIQSLRERNRPKIWTRLPYASTVADVLDVKSHQATGEAELILYLLKPTGELVGRYRGHASFDESFNPTEEVKPGARLNRALSDAVAQIQKQILEDRQIRTLAAR